ncbi:hypothetical protein [Legionella birminghamensis]|nr:hypothetical protein [Legionella birminghamensis]
MDKIRMKTIAILLVLIPALSMAQGCIIGNPPSKARYVCIDGRSLSCTGKGLVWNAKRGCFLSRLPCCAYEAEHYGYYPNPARMYRAYEQCRVDYPFRLGEMQTH